MRSIAVFYAFCFLGAVAGSAVAATTAASGTIGESATVVPGNSVSAYLIGTQIVTVTGNEETASFPLLGGRPPVLHVDFPRAAADLVVKHVAWDRKHRTLTVDF